MMENYADFLGFSFSAKVQRTEGNLLRDNEAYWYWSI